jgi:hypothetical protein
MLTDTPTNIKEYMLSVRTYSRPRASNIVASSSPFSFHERKVASIAIAEKRVLLYYLDIGLVMIVKTPAKIIVTIAERCFVY